jgi:hypothetical protein
MPSMGRVTLLAGTEEAGAGVVLLILPGSISAAAWTATPVVAFRDAGTLTP